MSPHCPLRNEFCFPKGGRGPRNSVRPGSGVSFHFCSGIKNPQIVMRAPGSHRGHHLRAPRLQNIRSSGDCWHPLSARHFTALRGREHRPHFQEKVVGPESVRAFKIRPESQTSGDARRQNMDNVTPVTGGSGQGRLLGGGEVPAGSLSTKKKRKNQQNPGRRKNMSKAGGREARLKGRWGAVGLGPAHVTC